MSKCFSVEVHENGIVISADIASGIMRSRVYENRNIEAALTEMYKRCTGWTGGGRVEVKSSLCDAIKNTTQEKKTLAIKTLAEIETPMIARFMEIDINEFTKEELVKILSMQNKKWMESLGFDFHVITDIH